MPQGIGRVRTQNVRAAASFLAAANENTASVRCFSARQVGWLFTATDADTLATANVQVSNDNVNWSAGVIGAAGFAVDDIGTAIGIALNGGGRWILLVPNGDGTTGRFPWCIPWFYARVNVIAGAADIDNFKVDAYIWDDIEFAIDGSGFPPAVL